MAKVVCQFVEYASIDVDKLLDLLIKKASAELTTFYYSPSLKVNLIGLEGEGPSGHFKRSGKHSPFVSKFLE